MRTERIQLVEQYINKKNVVSIAELSQRFQISTNTVRRDLDELARNEKIEKIYGGAKRIEIEDKAAEMLKAYSERNGINIFEKQKIAEAAASYISEGDIIFIDTGTSTVPILRYLSHLNHLTIITNSVLVLYFSLELKGFNVIGLPGILKHKTASLVGEQCYKMLDHYNINKAFMACTTFSLENGACNSSVEEYDIKARIVEKCSQAFLLADSSKFGRSALLTFARPEAFRYIITDKEPDPGYYNYLKPYGTEILIVNAAKPDTDIDSIDISVNYSGGSGYKPDNDSKFDSALDSKFVV